MDLPKLNTSKKYERRINVAALDKTGINENLMFGGITQQSVELRHDGLKFASVMDDLEKPGVKLDHKTVKMLLNVAMAKAHALTKSYEAISSPEKYIQDPFTKHDVDRAKVALSYQNDRLSEVMQFLDAAAIKGKSPAEALKDMAPDIFNKAAESDSWSGGRRVKIANPIEAAQRVSRPSDHRVIKQFFETVLDNIHEVDKRVAKMMPVVDYGLAAYKESLKPAKGTRKLPKAPSVTKTEQLGGKLEEYAKKISARSQQLGDLSQRSLQKNAERVGSYLDGIDGFYNLIERKGVVLEDIFQLTKARLETTASDLPENEMRDLFKQAVLDGISNFESKLNEKIAEDKVAELLERAQNENIIPMPRPKPPAPSGNNFGMLKAYAKAMRS